MNKNPEITDATRNAFVDAFCDLYINKPVEMITIKELTYRARYNRATFYRYFSDVYDLLMYLENTVIEYLKLNIIANIERGNLFENFINSFSLLLEGKERYFEVLMDNPHNTSFAHRLKSEMMPLIVKYFHLFTDEPNADYLLEFYLSGFISMISYWIHCKRNIPIAELSELIRSLLQDKII